MAFFAKIFNRIALATGVVNSQPLTVIKRGSKLPQTIRMTPVDVDGVKYLVSVRGETEWVKNGAPANPHVKLTTNSGQNGCPKGHDDKKTTKRRRRPVPQGNTDRELMDNCNYPSCVKHAQ